MPYKVVYNADFGGFSLSSAAVQLGREISGDPRWADATLPGEMYSDGSGPRGPEGSIFGDSTYICNAHPRHDPVLVRVVETLGEDANGSCASLSVAEVQGAYLIDEYDGLETVVEPDDQNWVDPSCVSPMDSSEARIKAAEDEARAKREADQARRAEVRSAISKALLDTFGLVNADEEPSGVLADEIMAGRIPYVKVEM